MFFQLALSRVLRLPIWWYGQGIAAFLKRLSQAISDVSKTLAIRVWMKNLFIPMYGDTSFAGRTISFGIRLVMIVIRELGVVLFSLLLFVGLLVYAAALPVVIFGLLYHLLGLFF
jgi:hypothetical protein